MYRSVFGQQSDSFLQAAIGIKGKEQQTGKSKREGQEHDLLDAGFKG